MTDQAKDKAMEEAEELLPCLTPISCQASGGHLSDCPAHYRPAAAQRLRDRDERYESLRSTDEKTIKGFIDRGKELESQLAAANAETDMWAKRCNDALFQRDQLRGQLAELKGK